MDHETVAMGELFKEEDGEREEKKRRVKDEMKLIREDR